MLSYIGNHIPQLFVAVCTLFGMVSLFVVIEEATVQRRRAR